MEQPHRRRRRKKTNYTGLIVIVLLTIVLVGLVVALLLLDKDGKKPEAGTSTTTTGEQTSSENNNTGNLNTPEKDTEDTSEDTSENTSEETSEETEDETLDEAPLNPTAGDKIAEVAIAQIGKAFKMGGQGPNEFDTSGFIQYCCTTANVEAPRLVPAQATHGKAVSRENIAPGDVIVFWSDGYPDEPAYCGIYVGDDRFVYCSSSKHGVVDNVLNNVYFEEHIFAVRRYY